ncbi:hypothetical protein [Streptomyces pinistramenti]|uniref:hypothetical protein n=1 Tax=Streptomyces pinistramenti TaxID=2884812 RepID=UPI001D071918|nr:hypothetical protein [Streptomyces pinistramenti]MCB5910395.1 hypothetical protein [Streptomyces pinistramenti]
MRWLRLAGHTVSSGRRRGWWVVALLCAAAVLSAAAATHAAADPAPSPAPSVSAQPPAAPSPGGAAAPGGGGGVAYEDTAKGKAAAKEALREKKEGVRKKLARMGIGKDDLLDSFHVTDENGIPVSAFTVDAESGAWSDWDLKVEAWLTNVLFIVIKWLIAFACWLITWALGFKLAALLLKPALAVSDSLYTSVLVQMGLPGLFLVFSGVTAAWHLLFGDRSRGWGELTASLLISALAATTFASPPQMLLGTQDGAVGKARDLGVAVASLVMGDADPTGRPSRDSAGAIATPISDEMVRTFVVQPSQVLTYGQIFTDDTKDKCATRFTNSRIETAFYNQKVAEQAKTIKDLPNAGDLLLPGVGGKLGDVATDKARQWALDTFGKKPDAEFEKLCVSGNAKERKTPSADKLVGAVFMLLAAALVCVLIIALAGSYLATQVWLAAEAMLARCALLVGTLPGPGRAWLWARGASIARGLALMVLLVVGLGVFVVAVTAVVGAEANNTPGGLSARFALVDVLCAGALVFRKRLTRTSHQWAARLKGRVGASKLGGAASPASLGPAGGGGRGTMGRIGGAALMLGLMAATGGTAGAIGAGLGRTGSTRALTGLARGAGRLARSAEKTARVGGRAGLRAGRHGLKSTVGLPVYGPRAVRQAATVAQAVPGQVTSAATQLRERLDAARSTYEPRIRDFADEYRHGLGLGGHWVRNRVLVGHGLPPIPARPRRPHAAAGHRPAAPAPARPPVPSPASAGAPRRSRRGQMVPQRPLTPPASSQQASLQQRLHRIRTRANAAGPPLTPPPAAAPSRRPVAPRSPRPGRRS